MADGEIAPAVKSQKLDERIQGMGIGQAVVPDLSPDAFEGDVAEGDAGVFADEVAEAQEVLVGPVGAVSPACFFFEESYNLRNQCFIGVHSDQK